MNPLFCGILCFAEAATAIDHMSSSSSSSSSSYSLRNRKIGVIELGYIGLSLAVEIGKGFQTVDFDIRSDHAPWADCDETAHEYGLRSLKTFKNGTYDVVVTDVGQHEFRKIGIAKCVHSRTRPTSCTASSTFPRPVKRMTGPENE